MRRLREIRKEQTGFTIVELMIATLVFSVILLVITYGVLSFSRAYYRGLNTARTQDTARVAIDKITQAIQFSGGGIATPPASTPVTTYCVGGVQYDFVLGSMQSDTNNVLYETPHDSSTPCSARAFDPATSKKLIPNRMRVANFTITPPSGTEGLFTVHIRVVYGDDDLLTPSATATDATCTGNAGFEYCAMADLVSTVSKRVK